jgi:hypothetical protein
LVLAPLVPLVPLALASTSCRSGAVVEAPVVVVVEGTDAGAPLLPVAVEPPPERAEDARSFVGRWEGTGTQSDGDSWPMLVEITALGPGVCATVDYPSIPCRGQWLCTGARPGVLEARERLLPDSVTRCVDGGTMKLRLGTDGALDWTWASHFRGSGVTASATLRRVR